MAIKISFPVVEFELVKDLKYKSSSYNSKKKENLWIVNTYIDGENYYNVCVLIKKNGTSKIEIAEGDINRKSVEIKLTQAEQENNIKIALNFAKEKGYL